MFHKKRTKSLYLALAIVWIFACQKNDTNSKREDPVEIKEDTKDDIETTANKITVSGTIALSTSVSASNAEELSPGDSVENATVFMKGFPDQTTASDADGAFILQLELPDDAGLNIAATEYTIVMWYQTNTSGNLFGTLEKFNAELDAQVDIGSANLDFTNAIHLSIKDEDTNMLITSDCTILVNGYSDKIPIQKTSNGRYDSSYMPPDDYEFVFNCENYTQKTVEITVEPASSLDAWMSAEILLQSSQ